MGIVPLSAQLPVLRDTVRYSVALGGLYSSGQYTPFWLQSLNYGRVYHTPTTAYGSVSILKDYGHRGRIIDWGLRADLMARTDMEINGIYTPIKKELYFQELYAKARFMSLQIIAGAKEEIIGVQDSTLTAGGFIFSKNARPIPKITAGFTDYVPIPSSNNKLLIKGALSHGWLMDKNYSVESYLHHKYVYLKIIGSDFPIWIEAGLDHFAQWGSHLSTTNINLINFIKVFFGKQGGIDASINDQVNALGNHVLSQNIKAGALLGDYTISTYWQNLSEDGPMKFFWAAMNREDGLFGLSIKHRNSRVINGLLYEFFHSVDQSGPYHDKDGMIYGGVDGYFGTGKGGWTYFGRTIGTPLITSYVYIENGSEKFINNTLYAHHLGIEGEIQKMKYKLLVTHSNNYGHMWGPYKSPKPNTSLLLELHRNWGGGFETGLSVGADIGKMYGNNYGAMITLKKSGDLFRLRAPRVVLNPLW